MDRTAGVAGLKDHIRQIPDFPRPGILFYDISTLLQHAGAWRTAVDALAEAVAPHEPDRLIGIEARGFKSIALADTPAGPLEIG